ncbi:retrovirus-related pol polyprotein from transposon TNT 1-94 [Tanacetum coccineum]
MLIYPTDQHKVIMKAQVHVSKTSATPDTTHLLEVSERTDRADGMTEGRKQNRNKSKSWKIGEIKYRQNITYWNCNQKGHFRNQCSKPVTSRDKEVNMETMMTHDSRIPEIDDEVGTLVHLKVFGCDSFVKVKDVCGEAMKCTITGSGSDKMRYSFQDTKSHQVIRSRDITFVDLIYGARSVTDSSSLTKPIQKSQVVLVDILDNLAENDSIFAEHEMSLEIT